MGKGNVISLVDVREEERRRFTRIVLQGLYRIRVVIPGPQGGLADVAVNDISSDGISFDLTSLGSFNVGDLVALRIYLSPEFYLPIAVKIQNVKAIGKGIMRHGARFERDPSYEYEAIHAMVKFLQAAQRRSKRDQGDRMILQYR
ncbi:MAG TPA: PilZ domain-containing protein [Bdellovibrionota bacterium]|nr:PilZ domain-containing protein [Bdellovibrionota bacterium]